MEPFFAPLGDYANQFMFVFTSIFLIVNPVGAAPLYLMATEKEQRAKKIAIAKKASIVAFCLLTIFLIVGAWILRFFGITIYSFKIAGGILLLLISINMLYKGTISQTKPSGHEVKKASQDKEDISVVPLAVPLLSGPGSLATVMVISSNYHGWAEKGVSLMAIACVSITIFYILRGADRLIKVLGVTLLKLLNRIMGLILAAIAVQFMLDGLKTAVKLWR